MSVLQVRALGKDYGDFSAVKSLDLAVDEGEVLGLLGPNGAGKTTTISMIAGTIRPTRGDAAVCGFDVLSQRDAARSALGVVPQDLALYEELDALQNLAYFGRLYGLSGQALAEAQDHALDVASLKDRASVPVKTFSGGMKRRLNLAIGMLHRPRLLICDEPTVGVDAQSRAHVFDAIKHLNREEGTTIIYTSHYMEEVQELCPRVAIMDHGELIAEDSLEKLLAQHAGTGAKLQIEGEAKSFAHAWPGSHAEGPVLRGPLDESLASVISQVEAAGAKVRSAELQSTDLENVFLTLTGHSLRDG